MAGRVRTAAVWGIHTPYLMSSSGWNKKSYVWCRPGAQAELTQTKSGKLMIIQSGSRRTKASQEAWQKALNALHLEKCVFLVQVMLLRDKMFVNVAHMERC
uniref:Zinc finger protein 268 n=1 Tax=Sciurus vulgaris TaxID=55149 RepID=A0A8D2CWJ5_SCIVU